MNFFCRFLIISLFAILTCILASGCGQTGPLTHPSKEEVNDHDMD